MSETTANLNVHKTNITALSESIQTLKKADTIDTAAIGETVKELLAAKQVYADANGGIGVDGKPYEPPMTKAEKKVKVKAEKAAKTKAEGGGGGGGGKEKAAPDSAKALKKAAKKAEAKAKKSSAAKGGSPTPVATIKTTTPTNKKHPSKAPNQKTNTKKRASPKAKLQPLQLAFSPNATLTDRPILALTIGCLTNTIDDVSISSDHSRTNRPVLGLPNGGELAGDFAIARYLARRPTVRLQLLGGDDAEMVALVDSWVDYATSLKQSAADDRLVAVAATLQTVLSENTYIVGDDLTLADIAIFSAMGFPTQSDDVQHTKHKIANANHVLRWMNMMRSHPSLREATQLAMGITNDFQAIFDTDAPPLEPLVSGMAPLEGATPGNVVTRFPPEPSGYLHVGHAKAILMNQYYAQHYKGRLIVRFDDTNPSKEKEEYQDSIMKDLDSLGVVPDTISFTSDYFHTIHEYALTMINVGLAYMDDTPQEEMQKERMELTNSKHRDQSVTQAQEYFALMTSGDEVGSKWCLRARINMQSKNGTMRDPVLYRQNNLPHHRTGNTYHAYPTYDLACPIVDSLEGVTHALRTTEYDDRNEQYKWIQIMLGLRRNRMHTFARLNFRHTLMSKRNLAWMVEEKLVDGWDDARFPTVRGVIRRGVNLEALRKFIYMQGTSRRIVNMEWGKFWAENKKEIDRYSKRFMAIDTVEHVELTVANGPEEGENAFLSTVLLPKDPSFGKRLLRIAKKVILEKVDVEGIVVGEEIVLMRWGVVKITKVDGGLDGDYLHEGNFKAAKRKVTWLAKVPETFNVTLTEFDNLIIKEKLDDGDDFKKFINPDTLASSTVIGDVGLKSLQKDEIIQLERRGYYRVDQPYMDAKRGLVLFMIPDGKAKAMSGLTGKLAHH